MTRCFADASAWERVESVDPVDAKLAAVQIVAQAPGADSDEMLRKLVVSPHWTWRHWFVKWCEEHDVERPEHARP